MLAAGYSVRPAITADLRLLPEIERLAGLIYKPHQEELGLIDAMFSDVTSVAVFRRAQKAGRLWVAVTGANQVVGFALVMEVGGCAHLEEIDVLPMHGRHGVGTALLERVCSWAGTAGYPNVTLRTFRDIPWNGPFYASRGFRIVDDGATLSAAHVALEAAERRRGLRTDLRVTMTRGVEN